MLDNLIANKTPLDFIYQLHTWNYQYNEATDQFFKYVGMGMMVLKPNWELMFIIKGKNKILVHSSETIRESIEEIPEAEALIFAQYLDINNPLMLTKP
jgi:hypothetical protein